MENISRLERMSTGINYRGNELCISNEFSSMRIPCNEEFACKILSALQASKESPISNIIQDACKRKEIDRLSRKNDRDSTIKARILEGYIEVGDFGTGVLFVGYREAIPGLCSFAYVSHELPSMNGSNIVNVFIIR